MISIASQFGQVSYNVVKLILDTKDDLINLPTGVKPGSTAFVIETSETWMMNSQNQWKQVNISNTGGGSGGGGNEDDPNKDIIYEGGTIT